MCTVCAEFTNVCIPKVQTRRLQEHTCHSSCLKHWVDTGTGHCWGRKRSSENHVGHTYILPNVQERKGNPKTVLQCSFFIEMNLPCGILI